MKRQLGREKMGEEWYEYVPLGTFVASTQAVCRGRPTFKYTRIEVAGMIGRLGTGHGFEVLIADSRGRPGREAIAEATAFSPELLDTDQQEE
jgi:uncharacterized protein (DUF433 family)